jgi:hypothetical protein
MIMMPLFLLVIFSDSSDSTKIKATLEKNMYR